MTRRLMLVGLTTAAFGLSAAAAEGSATTHKCGNQGSAVRDIRATGTTCKTAHKVVTADLQGKRYNGWKCRAPRVIGKHLKVTCTHKGSGKISWTLLGG